MNIPKIESVHNPKVKQWAELLHKKGRDKHGKFIVEGIHLVKEAIEAEAAIESIVFAERLPDELSRYQKLPLQWIEVSESVLKKCTSTETPQRVFAVLHKSRSEHHDWFTAHTPLVVVLDRVQDPGNVGTIIRSAEASGASGVIIGQGSADLYNPKTVRATMGAMFRIPIVEGDLLPYLQEARTQGIHVVSTSLRAERSCYEIDWRQGIWFVVGNEGSGVSALVAEQVDEMITIPMLGQAESLNAAMATTVLLFEAMRQRAFST